MCCNAGSSLLTDHLATFTTSLPVKRYVSSWSTSARCSAAVLLHVTLMSNKGTSAFASKLCDKGYSPCSVTPCDLVSSPHTTRDKLLTGCFLQHHCHWHLTVESSWKDQFRSISVNTDRNLRETLWWCFSKCKIMFVISY